MNYKLLCRLLGSVLIIEAALLTLPLLVSLIYAEAAYPFLITIAVLIAVALPLVTVRPQNQRMYAKEGFVCVGASWILMSLFGALPFVISGSIPNFVDAFFETVSGFTTTGASILTEVESLPYGILFWRSFTHWVGGMGILVFMMAVIPTVGGSSIHLMRAEVPGPQKGKLVPKMRETALILYGIYVIITVAQVIALLIAGLPLFDAVVNSFATAGTGGFSVKNASIGAYGNPAAEWIIAIFMMICGINFNLYYFIIIKKLRSVFKNEELRVYIALTLISTALIAINVWNSIQNSFESVADCIRAAFFQVTSIMSTSGFSTVNYDLWPEFSKILIVILTFLGASAGSTAGGLKISRLLIILKTIRIEVKKMVKPSSVNPLRLDGDTLPDTTGKTAMNYFVFYIMIFTGTLLLISVDSKDFITTFTAAATCFNNVGPGLAEVGPFGNFSAFSYFSKLVLSFAMLFGRLEIMPMFIMLSPSTWRGSFRRNKA